MSFAALQYIQDHVDLIREGDFDSLYKDVGSKEYLIPEITKTLLDAEVDPLEYLHSIPNRYAFCLTEIKDIVIPPSVRTIRGSAFAECPNLTTAVLPSTILAIKNEAFSFSSKLKSINLPDSCLFIGQSAFAGTALKEVVLPKQLGTVYGQTFAGCTNLQSVKFGDSISWIASQAFMNCSSLTEISLPESLEILSDDAFAGCSNLTKVSFSFDPKHSLDLGIGVFSHCPQLTQINFSGTKRLWLSRNTIQMFDRTANLVVKCSDGKLRLNSSSWIEVSS